MPVFELIFSIPWSFSFCDINIKEELHIVELLNRIISILVPIECAIWSYYKPLSNMWNVTARQHLTDLCLHPHSPLTQPSRFPACRRDRSPCMWPIICLPAVLTASALHARIRWTNTSPTSARSNTSHAKTRASSSALRMWTRLTPWPTTQGDARRRNEFYKRTIAPCIVDEGLSRGQCGNLF